MDTKDIEAKLIILVKDFVSEFKSERAKSGVLLQSELERDLGIDSLGRVELFLRIEKTFGVSLPESIMIEVQTLQDIAVALSTSYPTITQKPKIFADVLEASTLDPSSANTLMEVLSKYAAHDPKRPHIYLVKEQDEEIVIRYGELFTAAKKVAAGLQSLGLKSLETVALMLPTSEEFFYAFFGVLLAGGIPVPIYPPVRADRLEEYAVREAKILNNAEVRILITFSQAETLSKLLRVFIPSLKSVTTVPLLMQMESRLMALSFEGENPALIQYTSGSTSDPKGVLLSHDNLLANIRCTGQAANLGPTDVGVSWLPLYHDMGLIGAWFCSLYHGFPITIMSPLAFLSKPERWLWAIHYHRGTLSAGPNFAYELCIRKIRPENIEGLDLSSWRLAFNGAEAVNPHTMERFIKKFKPYGLKAETLFPVYGLAENSVALCFPALGETFKTDVIQREAFEVDRIAKPATLEEKEAKNTLEFVACGFPLPEHDIRIVDENDHELEERKIGCLQFCGPSAMRGYYHNTVATQSVYHDGWWDTGDFAYIADGELYITGRKKDIIIKAGRNLYPQEIEEVTGQVSGIRKGCVVAFGMHDPHFGTEKLVVVAETQETNAKIRDKMINEINEKILDVIGVPPDQVSLVPPRSIPKTSSGKLRRSACKKLYEEGSLIQSGLPVWLQMSKLIAKGAATSLYHNLGKVGKWLYTAYFFLCAFIILPLIMLDIVLLPKEAAITGLKWLSRLFIFLIGNFITVHNKENLSKISRMIYICNHASYCDSLFLFAILPKNTLFVVKKELLNWPIIGRAIKKFEFLTVDRLNFQKNIADTALICKSMDKDQSVLLYPEGTFTYATGLRPFKMGAFKIAVDTESPLCPIAMKGTRRFMRGDNILLTPTRITITVGEPIYPQGKEWAEVARIHAEARSFIANHCGELMIDMLKAGPEFQ